MQFADAMNNIPIIWKMNPREPTVPKVAAFEITRKKPFHADLQKFFADNAI